jgi:hypothetical protein
LSRFPSLIIAVAVCFAALPAGLAAAQTCYRLQGELADLQSRSGGGGDRDRYERAYQEQAEVIARTERRARDAGCFGGFFFKARPGRSCNTLLPKLQDMQANLWKLDQLRRQGGRRHDNQARILALQFMIAARGCDPWGAGSLEARQDPMLDPFGDYSSGTYRTLCVRTCDGYYFPISFSTTREFLPEDERTCQAMCPGTEAKLFFHDNPGGGPENMTALDGQAYSSLATAFQYRTKISNACTCRPAGGYAAITASASQPAGAGLERTAPLPRPKPAPGEDPETLANRAGDFTPDSLPEEPAATASVNADGQPSVRVVGPAYLGSSEQDDMVIAPVPN